MVFLAVLKLVTGTLVLPVLSGFVVRPVHRWFVKRFPLVHPKLVLFLSLLLFTVVLSVFGIVAHMYLTMFFRIYLLVSAVIVIFNVYAFYDSAKKRYNSDIVRTFHAVRKSDKRK